MTKILLKHFQAPERIQRIIATFEPYILELSDNSIDESRWNGFSVLSCSNVKPHVDSDFTHALTTLIVLHSAEHELFVSTTRSKAARESTRKPKHFLQYKPEIGDIMTFNSACIHWMTGSNPPFQAIVIDWNQKEVTDAMIVSRVEKLFS